MSALTINDVTALNMPYKDKHVSVIIPAHNEAGSIASVVKEIVVLENQQSGKPLVDDIIVCDNDSDDGTSKLAIDAGATVVYESRKGYGAACLKGIETLNRDTKLVVFIDGDSSVESTEIELLLETLVTGADIVIGNRENSRLHEHALSVHQRFGNKLATILIRRLWKKQVNDLGPFRAIRYSHLLALDMQDTAFGWTVEMQVKAIQAKFAYQEIDVTTKQRIGKSKISGTVRGTIGAGIGIFSKIIYLYWNQKKFLNSKLVQKSLKAKL